MTLRTGVFQYLSVDALDCNTIEHRTRITPKSIKRLVTTISRSQIMTPIIVVSLNGTYIVIDGHRRVEVARILGLTQVPVVVYKGLDSEIELLRMHNSTQRFNGANYLTSYVMAADKKAVLRMIPKHSAEHIKIFAQTLGAE